MSLDMYGHVGGLHVWTFNGSVFLGEEFLLKLPPTWPEFAVSAVVRCILSDGSALREERVRSVAEELACCRARAEFLVEAQNERLARLLAATSGATSEKGGN